MDVTRMIQVAVARADLMICTLRALPWGKIAASLIIAAILMKVVRQVEIDRRHL